MKATRPTKPAIAVEPVLAPVYCNGWRYNFKKGIEYCKNAGTCIAHINYNNSDEPYNLEQIGFDSMKDFRNCKGWLNRCITLVVWLVADCGLHTYQITQNYKRVVTLKFSTNTAINYTTC